MKYASKQEPGVLDRIKLLDYIEQLNKSLEEIKAQAIPTILNRTKTQQEFSALIYEIKQAIDKKANQLIRESGIL